MSYPIPSPIRVSTITILSYLNCHVNLKNLFYAIPIELDPMEEGIIHLKLHFKEEGKHFLLVRNVDDQTVNRLEVKNHFQNQLTIVWRFKIKDGYRRVNSMLFSNGKIKAVGLRDETEMDSSIVTLQQCLNRSLTNLLENRSIDFQDTEKNELRFENTRCCMINTDFTIYFRILRDSIFKILHENYNVVTSYEPDIYPGVKIRYYFNVNHESNKGICQCTQKCRGKGRGRGDGDCKAVTICLFQSGNIIITGGNAFEQIHEAYAFINELLKKYYNKIVYSEPKVIMNEHGEMIIQN